MTTAESAQAAKAGVEKHVYEQDRGLPYASRSLRMVGGILDLVVLGSLAMIWASMAGFYLLTQTDWGNDSTYTAGQERVAIIILATYAFIVPAYFFLLWSWRGQTVGQMAVRIMVTDRDGYHISYWQALLRTLLLPVSVLPLGAGFFAMFFDKETRAVHDMIAGTVVLEHP